MVLIPFIWSSLQWRLLVDSTTRTTVSQTGVDLPIVISQEGQALGLLQRQKQPLIPPSLYEPDSLNPLQIVYIGGYRMLQGKSDKEPYFSIVGDMLPSLQLSKYLRVTSTFLYNHADGDLRIQEQRDTYTAAVSVAIVDWTALRRDCHVLERILQYITTSSSRIILMDGSASPSIQNCSGIHHDVVTVKRSVVQHRRFDFDQQWVVPGTISSEAAATTHWMPDFVPDAFVNALRHAASGNRTTPVAHYWSSATLDEDIPQLQYDALRRRVRSQLERTRKRLNKKQEAMAPWLDPIGIQSEARESSSKVERDIVQESAEALVLAQIVVVTQADEWEHSAADHRLLEALASGALVFSDTMVGPIADDLQPFVVFFDSAEHLDERIVYYLRNEGKRLEMARRGQNVALGRYRSWHALETLLFGKAITRTDKGWAKNPGKSSALDEAQVRFVHTHGG